MSDAGQISIFDTRGVFMTTIEADFTQSYVLSAPGKCSFTLSTADPKLVRKYLDNGRFVYFRHAQLPDWAGVIDGFVNWGADGLVSFSAYSGEHLLKYRITEDNGQLLKGGSAGALFTKLIDMANRAGDTMVRVGDVWGGGTDAEDTMDGRSIYEHVAALATSRNNDFSVDGVIDEKNGNLYFEANWYEKRGETLPLSFGLEEGHNVALGMVALKLQGNIVNELTGYGDGDDDDVRPRVTLRDDESIARHGLRQGSRDFAGVTSLGTLRAHVQRTLLRERYQRASYKVFALNVGDTFSRLRLGNVVRLKLSSVGFFGDAGILTRRNVRIFGMRYASATDRVELILDEDELGAE